MFVVNEVIYNRAAYACRFIIIYTSTCTIGAGGMKTSTKLSVCKYMYV